MEKTYAYEIQLFSTIETLRELYQKRAIDIELSDLSEDDKEKYLDRIENELQTLVKEKLPTMDSLQAAHDRYHEIRNELITRRVIEGVPVQYTVLR